PPAPVTRLELTRRAQRRGVGRDRRDGALAHLAAAADSAAAAHRVQVDAELACRIEDGGAPDDLSPPAGREEHDPGGVAHPVARRRPPRRRLSPSGEEGSRWRRIHAAQSQSLPVNTSEALIAAMISGSSGLVIADVRPAPIAIARKAALMPARLGRPKLMLEAPHVVFTCSSSRRRRIRWSTWRPAVGTAPMGMTRGSTTTSWRGMP